MNMKQFNSQPVLQTAYAHRSIRKFTEQPISPEMLNALLEAGRAASSSSFMQTVHIIRVTDLQIRRELRSICSDQPYVEHCAEFLVFCADYAKHKNLVPEAQTEWTELVLIGAIDAGIFAQNILLATESVGLGGVYIGSLRNNARHAAELLNLPQYVMPLFGMCLGYPAQDPLPRQRLPLESIISENRYCAPDEQKINEYNDLIKDYYRLRSNLDLDWQQQIAKNLCRPVRPDILSFLNDQGLAKK